MKDAVQVDDGGQLGAGLLTSAHLAVQPPQPEVAVGHERAHAEGLGQRLLVRKEHPLASL